MTYIYTKNNSSIGLYKTKLKKGNWGIQSISYGRLTKKHLDYLNILSSKFKIQIKFNFIFNKIHTKKPLESRMGGGKSNIVDKLYYIKPGNILLEFYEKSYCISYMFLKKVIYKLPLKLRLIKLIY